MARPFTTKPPVQADDPESDLEIQLEPLDTHDDTENAPSYGNMTTAPPKVKVNGNAIKKKLGGAWMKLVNLPPQELVSELKVRKMFTFIYLFIYLSIN